MIPVWPFGRTIEEQTLAGIETSQSNGLEAYRQLLSSLEPVSRNNSLGVLNAILGWSSFYTQKNMLSQLVKLEDAFREYEKTGATLAEEICVNETSFREHQEVATTAGFRTTSYVTLREKVLEYDKATLKWSQAMMLTSATEKLQPPRLLLDVNRQAMWGSETFLQAWNGAVQLAHRSMQMTKVWRLWTSIELRTKGKARGRLKTVSQRAKERTIKVAKAKELEVRRAMRVRTKKAGAKGKGRSNLPGKMTKAYSKYVARVASRASWQKIAGEFDR